MSHLLSNLPASHLAAVETALQQAFGTHTVTDVRLLTGGLSAASVYKIIVNGSPYVLKVDMPAASGQTERDTGAVGGQAGEHKASNQQLAADAGVAPPLYHQDTITGISISGLIDNKPLRSSFTPDKLTPELARTIRAIHSIPYQAVAVDLKEIIDGLIGRFKQSRMLTGAVFNECFGHYEAVSSVYPWQDTEKVFSHNDLNPNNILSDGKRIWIIDWDVASVNDRYVDLANTANYFVHTQESEKVFLGTYFGHPPDDYQLSRLFIMRQVCRIIYSMLMLHLAAQHKPADHQHDQEMEGMDIATFSVLMGTGKLSLASYEGQLMYGKALINEALRQMQTPRWATAMANLG